MVNSEEAYRESSGRFLHIQYSIETLHAYTLPQTRGGKGPQLSQKVPKISIAPFTPTIGKEKPRNNHHVGLAEKGRVGVCSDGIRIRALSRPRETRSQKRRTHSPGRPSPSPHPCNKYLSSLCRSYRETAFRFHSRGEELHLPRFGEAPNISQARTPGPAPLAAATNSPSSSLVMRLSTFSSPSAIL